MLRRFNPLTLLVAVMALAAAPLLLHAAPPAPVHVVAVLAPRDSAPAVPAVDSLPAVDSPHALALTTHPPTRSDSMVRAKFVVQDHQTTKSTWGEQTRVRLTPQYDTSIPEDQRYSKATPCGEIWMQVDNPAALEALPPGKAFYVDFVPVES